MGPAQSERNCLPILRWQRTHTTLLHSTSPKLTNAADMVSWSPMPSLMHRFTYSSRSSCSSQGFSLETRDGDHHFHRIFKGDTSDIARARHQHNLFSRLKLRTRPGIQKHVLEIGCGSGEAALELAEYANVMVVGIDESARQVGSVSCLWNKGLLTRHTCID